MKYILFILFVIASPLPTSAQISSVPGGTLFFKIGLPQKFLENDYTYRIPHVSMRYDRQINNNLSLGGDAGFFSTRSTKYRFLGDTYFYRKNYVTIFLNTTYFIDMISFDKYRFYGGLGAGYKLGLSKFVGRGELSTINSRTTPPNSGIIYSIFLQGRYPITPQLFAYLEIGLGYLPISLGVVHNLNP